MSKDQRSHNKLVAWAINSPYSVIVICLMFVILGGLAMMMLPKDLLPPSNLPAVQILSFYSGMPVKDVEENLTSRFERYTGQAVGIEHQESKSLVGVSIVKNFFNSDTDLNTAIAQTTSLVMSVLRRLPPGTQPPLILPFDPMASIPLALVTVSGDHKQSELFDVANYDLRNTLQSVSGVVAPTVMGGAERQVVLYLDSKKLNSYNLSPLRVIDLVARFNSFVPPGDVKIGDYDYQITSNGIPDKISEINDFPVRAENGVPIYLQDVGQATDSTGIQTNYVLVDNKAQVYVPIYRQPGSNSIQIIDQVKEEIKKIGKRVKDYQFRLVFDQSIFIRHAIHSITEEALIGGVLASIMVFLFLGNPISTIGILLSLPLSILATFLALKVCGQTLNAMTLGGIALSVGVLVDNAIVVLENISNKFSSSDTKGLSPKEMALQGGSEVAVPVLASTLATLVVFLPVFFLSGIIKILFGALALTVMLTMVSSYYVAMTVIPLFAATYLHKASQKKLPSFLAKIQKINEKFTRKYGAALKIVLKNRKLVLSIVVILILIACALVPLIGTELFPKADAGNFTLMLRGKTGTRIEETNKLAKVMNEKLKSWIDPDDLSIIITNAGILYGYAAAFTSNTGTQDVFFNVELTENRKHTSQYYAKLIRQKIHEEFPDVEIGFQLGGLMTSALNMGALAPIDVQIEGHDQYQSHKLAEQLVEKFKKIKGVVDARIQERIDAPEINLDINRKAAGDLGLTSDDILKSVVGAVTGSSTFNNSIWVDPKSGIDYLFGVQFPESDFKNFDDLNNIPITGLEQAGQKRSVPLGRLAKISLGQSFSEIRHVNYRPVIDILMDAQDRDIGSVSQDVDRVVRASTLPEGYTTKISGEISEMKKGIGSLGGGFLLAAILAYLILVMQFKSFKLPLIIMTTVPLGLIGIVFMFVVTNTYFSIQGAIGAIFMIGIAVAHGVLLIEFILHESSQANDMKEMDEAIIRGSEMRLRPILMTALASILSLIPMALGLGKGSEANIPLGRAVVGGQILSTTLTLFVIPILFRIFYSIKDTRILETSIED